MYCSNCGKKLNDDEKFCSNCGNNRDVKNEVKNNSNNVENTSNNQSYIDKSDGNSLALLSLVFGFGTELVVLFISRLFPNAKELFNSYGISGFCSLIGIVLMIVARVKYPHNRLAKIAMWVYIIKLVLYLVLVVLFFATCIFAFGTLPR